MLYYVSVLLWLFWADCSEISATISPLHSRAVTKSLADVTLVVGSGCILNGGSHGIRSTVNIFLCFSCHIFLVDIPVLMLHYCYVSDTLLCYIALHFVLQNGHHEC